VALSFVDFVLSKQRDYQKLYNALHALTAVRALEFLWAFNHGNTSCSQVQDHL